AEQGKSIFIAGSSVVGSPCIITWTDYRRYLSRPPELYSVFAFSGRKGTFFWVLSSEEHCRLFSRFFKQ
ncbi:unnamed protein product, partial [Hermetia illucens]